ncbi:MAG: SUMF1/EgtB/PvdO family nonheme iron enzyme [Spirochaetales bacterium]|nr:SUMF1/EgtB/PvdO family nonheme iron enzyme [Spirochaetales bacterium]
MKKMLVSIFAILLLAGMTACSKKTEEAVKKTEETVKEVTVEVTKAAEKAVQKVSKLDPMVLVQGGTFKMGGEEKSNEKPIHDVTVSDFYIGRYEVTVQEWYDFLTALDKKDFEKAKKFTTSAVVYDNDGNLQMMSTKYIDDASCAANEIIWYSAVEYCNWKSEKEGLQKAYTINGEKVTCDFTAKGYRLPTEAEWEFAARGGNISQGYKYSGGSNYLKVAWMSENSGDKVHPVGTKDPNELGIYDMSGNLSEWCWDWYGSYTSDAQTNPTGPTTGSGRVERGGNWVYSAGYCRVAGRDYFNPYVCSYFFGFRLSRTP